MILCQVLGHIASEFLPWGFRAQIIQPDVIVIKTIHYIELARNMLIQLTRIKTVRSNN
jgi:hypothetical protein